MGAGLPVISTLQTLLNTGDELLSIEGILSGTLSFIFNSFGAGKTFSQVVAEAKAKGFTEPDPREDLAGDFSSSVWMQVKCTCKSAQCQVAAVSVASTSVSFSGVSS